MQESAALVGWVWSQQLSLPDSGTLMYNLDQLLHRHITFGIFVETKTNANMMI